MMILHSLHLRLLRRAHNFNIMGLTEAGMDDETYKAMRELYWDGYLERNYSHHYFITNKGEKYLQDLERVAKWNRAVGGKGGAK